MRLENFSFRFVCHRLLILDEEAWIDQCLTRQVILHKQTVDSTIHRSVKPHRSHLLKCIIIIVSTYRAITAT